MNWKFDFSPETSAKFMSVSVGSSPSRRISVFETRKILGAVVELTHDRRRAVSKSMSFHHCR